MSRTLVDSGIEWLGKIPEVWKVNRFKTVLNERNELNKDGLENFILSLTIADGVIPYSEKQTGGNKAKEDVTKYKIAKRNDIIINSMNVVVGAAGISNYDGVISPVYYSFYKKEGISDHRYYYYLFMNKTYQDHLFGMGNGILVKISEESGKMNTIRKKIPVEKIKNDYIPVPTLEEQKRIADYLDSKCSKIDQVIEDNNKAIELLEEYKKSKIRDCVVHGIDKVKLKRINIDIMDQIPEIWEVGKLKNYINIFNGKDCKKDLDSTNIPVYGSGGIFGYTSDYLYDGESLLLGRKGTIDRPILVSGKFWTVDTMFYSIPKINCNLKYIYYYMSVLNWDKYIFGTALPSMTQSILNDVRIPFISKQEQDRIVEHLDIVCKNLDDTIEYRKKIIEKLEEYKKSLIYEVVTGKKEV